MDINQQFQYRNQYMETRTKAKQYISIYNRSSRQNFWQDNFNIIQKTKRKPKHWYMKQCISLITQYYMYIIKHNHTKFHQKYVKKILALYIYRCIQIYIYRSTSNSIHLYRSTRFLLDFNYNQINQQHQITVFLSSGWEDRTTLTYTIPKQEWKWKWYCKTQIFGSVHKNYVQYTWKMLHTIHRFCYIHQTLSRLLYWENEIKILYIHC